MSRDYAQGGREVESAAAIDRCENWLHRKDGLIQPSILEAPVSSGQVHAAGIVAAASSGPLSVAG